MLRVLELFIRIANWFNPTKVKVDKIADYVIEQGVKSGWTYRKWNSGIIELWTTKTMTSPLSTSYSSRYYYTNCSYSIPFSITDYTNTRVDVEIDGDGVDFVGNAHMKTETMMNFQWCNATSYTPSNGRAYINVTGKWK